MRNSCQYALVQPLNLATLSAAICLWACGTPSADNDIVDADSIAVIDASLIDASAPTVDASKALDADLSSCVASSIWYALEDRVLRAGDYCDDIQLCAANATVAASVMATVPGFSCSNSPLACGDEYSCVWYSSDVIDADAYADLCEITVVENAPTLLTCTVYL